MKKILPIVMLALIAAGGACSKGPTKADSTLSSDLSLAAQQRQAFALDSAERAGELKAQPARHSANGTVARSSGTSSGTVAPASSGTVVEKHTQRDAAIGAVAGGLIGATTTKNKVKGGIIGAAVGGILGGVVGNNVDKTKKKKP
jgi:outer membrane protein with glycine zipper